ncbi:MAG: endolytic transglycosylase MltG [Deltaproteobacteria bacterium HGW-Deltaproteobacteria-4]|nr:MAG: endolytic transglycosylase MltG [Deltaproteobacteria bacterium HGW-Deltaproteobacteria-4]
MTRRTSIILAFLCLLLPPTFLLGQFWLFTTRPITPPTTLRLSIPPGMSITQTAVLLEKNGIITSANNFRFLTRLKKGEGAIKIGIYDFSKAATPGEILRRLLAGDIVLRRITIPEGFALKEIAARLENLGYGPAHEFLRLSRDSDFLKSLDLPGPSLEGYLFPETYFAAIDAAPRQLLQMMVREFRKRLSEELITAAKEQGLTLPQLVTLASIVQKEARKIEEMPIIASVFHNRLRRRMPLQADPTVTYGINNSNSSISKADLQRRTPYNTYKIEGLPPGPIASPGADALRATAYPAQTNYLYFVARGDGSHVFSADLKSHNDAVRSYRLRQRASAR